MALAFFYNEEINKDSSQLVLNEETSKHVVQVLRMQNGAALNLTDGKGNLFTAEITDNHRKKCAVKIVKHSTIQQSVSKVSIAISLIKNNNRFEWFLEKATEIGVHEIIPLICDRTEKQHFRFERMKGILISAMLQSQQCWLPVLHEPVSFNKLLQSAETLPKQKFIAYCEEENTRETLTHQIKNNDTGKLILIGPEGDFTKREIAEALQNHFIPVSLGETRLRTETAGIVAAVLLFNT